jgi:hypothetical protein
MKDHRNAPPIPKNKAMIKEEINCETRAFAWISPVVISPNMLSGMAKVNTSDSADSIIRVVDVLGLMATFFTNPTTTADEVPPRAAPINRQDKKEMSKIK